MTIPDSVYEALNIEKTESPEERKQSPENFLSKSRQSTKEAPSFFKVAFGDFVALCACMGTREIEFEEDCGFTSTKECAKFRIIEGEHAGQGRELPVDEIKFVQEAKPSPLLMETYKAVTDSIKCTIKASAYPEVEIPDGMSDFEIYCMKVEPIYTQTYCPEGVHTLDEAEEWLLKNHPEEFIGWSASNSVGDFSFGCVPQAFEDESKRQWTTFNGREELVKKWATARGFEVGEFDYSRIEAELARQEKE